MSCASPSTYTLDRSRKYAAGSDGKSATFQTELEDLAAFSCFINWGAALNGLTLANDRGIGGADNGPAIMTLLYRGASSTISLSWLFELMVGWLSVNEKV
jgi:hypothetical protein